MVYRLSPNDRCPCDSGRRIKSCCWQRGDNSLRPRQARTLTTAPATGYANARCYAAPLDDCSTKITGEHTLSHSVLRELSPTGIIEVNGLPRRPHEEFVSVPISGFTCNVLCDRHNAALSPLDSIGHRFFKSLKAINAELRDKSKKPRTRPYLFNGHDVERYILKILCGDGFANKMNSISIPVFIHSAIQILARFPDFDIGLIHPIRRAAHFQIGTDTLVDLRRVSLYPTVHGRVVYIEPAFFHDLLYIAIRE